MTVAFTDRLASLQQQIMTRADEPKRENPFCCILEMLTPEQVDQINDCLNTHYKNSHERFKAISKAVFGDIAQSISELRDKVICMEDLMTFTIEYCFAKEFANKNGDNNMENAKKAVTAVNSAMTRAEGAAEERSRLGTEASGSAGMQLG